MLTPARFRVLAAVTALFAYLQITLGGLVRVSGSGLGCPDWPTCYGRPYPPLNLHAIIEYSHRTVGAITGLLIIATVVVAFLTFRGRRSPVNWLTLATLGTVIIEGLLGGLVVRTELQPVLVLVHLGIAMLILAFMIAAALLAEPVLGSPSTGAIGRLLPVALVLTYLMLLTGSSVVASGADDVCRSWPLCGNGFQPDFTGVASFAMLHRFTVGVVALLLLHVLSLALRRHRSVRGVGPVAGATIALLIVQIAIGALTAVNANVAALQGLHLAFGSGTWAGMVALTVLIRRPALRAAGDGPALALERGAA